MRKYSENILGNQKIWQYFGNFQVGARNLKYSGNTFENEKQSDIGNLEDERYYIMITREKGDIREEPYNGFCISYKMHGLFCHQKLDQRSFRTN